MSQQPPQPPMIEWLAKIEKHLASIRTMMQFFVVMLILVIIVQACSVLISFTTR